ncbi:glutathione S-transferase family protein [uncultured Phenylobacterium sp.]|uniref:glutathione S-transferase family protein n=1 Tax=uncultured Phenylobacterium sp. TaxID=349273 RepID=UPI0025EA4B3D|nr:glutathione S-transferase family protein [uncultured Phenylobacterium sp.]
MKLYGERNPAPNPRRVRIFVAEKGIDLPEIRVELGKGEHKSPEHLKRNSLGQVPALELDDGRTLSESVSICRYLEALHPNPPLFGRDPYEIGAVDQWIRRTEMRLMQAAAMVWIHADPRTAAIIKQNRELGEANKPIYAQVCAFIDGELAGREFLATNDFTMADIILQTTVDFALFLDLPIPEGCANLKAWHERVSARPSAGANA